MLNAHFDNDSIMDIIRDQCQDDVMEECKRIAPEVCRECNELRPYFNNNTEAFDLEIRLRGHSDIRMVAVCDEFEDGCKPEQCSKHFGRVVEKLIEDIEHMETPQTPAREIGNYELIRSRLYEIIELKKTA
jgi:hypothetical protein